MMNNIYLQLKSKNIQSKPNYTHVYNIVYFLKNFI